MVVRTVVQYSLNFNNGMSNAGQQCDQSRRTENVEYAMSYKKVSVANMRVFSRPVALMLQCCVRLSSVVYDAVCIVAKWCVL